MQLADDAISSALVTTKSNIVSLQRVQSARKTNERNKSPPIERVVAKEACILHSFCAVQRTIVNALQIQTRNLQLQSNNSIPMNAIFRAAILSQRLHSISKQTLS